MTYVVSLANHNTIGVHRGQAHHSMVEIAEKAAKRFRDLKPKEASPFVVLGNIYCMTGNREKEEKLRQKMRKLKVKKSPGQTWITIGGHAHSFIVGQQCEPEVYNELKKLQEEMKGAGYRPNTSWVAWSEEDEEEKAERLCYHSEKLAIAYGLTHTPPGTSLLLSKNLRVCPDCHAAAKLIAKLRNRRIVVRDASRFHHFDENGQCSCGDYY